MDPRSGKKAIGIKPNDPGLYYGLGLTYVASGRKVDAVRIYQKLQTLDPKKAKELYEAINQ